MQSSAPTAALKLGASQVNIKVEPLFKSIKPPTKASLAQSPEAPSPEWHVVTTTDSSDEINPWEMCHHLVGKGMGVTGLNAVEFAEPDLEQQWTFGHDAQLAFSVSSPCGDSWRPNPRAPVGESGSYWFRDDSHSQLQAAREEVGDPGNNRVRIAHFDTGYGPNHVTKPMHLLDELQRNFVDDGFPNDASDRSSGIANNLGHGTGTLSILAGASVEGVPLGGAAFLGVIPIRVANSVVLFKNSAIAQALDYVHSLMGDPQTRVHVITMSMGGLASQAWADAVNALYDLGVFMVAAAGNNFSGFPTHNIVYPARFKRVMAACGVMADGRAYTDLPFKTMTGNYGPSSKMETALSAFTPNVPWARLACDEIVDFSGQGTSAATPQIASAAALWIQKYKSEWESYSQDWMRVEAVRKALFDSARTSAQSPDKLLGRGSLRAQAALAQQPARETDLKKEEQDVASFPFLRAMSGLGMAPTDVRYRMLELEALQLSQRSHELEELLPDQAETSKLPPATSRQIIEALVSAPGASRQLKEVLGKKLRSSQVTVPVLSTRVLPKPRSKPVVRPEELLPDSEAELKNLSPAERKKIFDALIASPGALRKLKDALRKQSRRQEESRRVETTTTVRAIRPRTPPPVKRSLQVFAFDPLAGLKVETIELNKTILDVRWEEVQPGPIGNYLEVVDIDPPSGVAYAPVDLNQPLHMSQAGLAPSESDPQFHQQMVYAVAMKTIAHFEHALGRVALWAPRRIEMPNGEITYHYVPRLRIYPHAMREANAYYSPEKSAVLFGYFPASESNPGENIPGQTVFCCLSHDIVAHETTHALLDGLNRRFREPTNIDVLAFHEAFSDIVALFQHFTVPEALRHQIAKTRGDLAKQNLLGDLAQQFGQGIGQYGALRSAIGKKEKDSWIPITPSSADYQSATEAHSRGAVLVAAIFDAFLKIYQKRTYDLIRLATGGTGVLPEGDIPQTLIERLAVEASKTAAHVLNICIRALDYCPPMDITFGEYIRALITADYDLVPDDPLGYRVAFTEAFRRRGIYPQLVRNLSTESVRWESPELDLDIEDLLENISLAWDLRSNREGAYNSLRENSKALKNWLAKNVSDDQAYSLGFYRSKTTMTVGKETGKLSPFEVHSVRPVRRVGPSGQQQLDLVAEITQTWTPDQRTDDRYRGGSTIIIGLEDKSVRYTIRKRVAHPERIDSQQSFRLSLSNSSMRRNYFDDITVGNEPFAMLHRSV